MCGFAARPAGRPANPSPRKLRKNAPSGPQGSPPPSGAGSAASGRLRGASPLGPAGRPPPRIFHPPPAPCAPLPPQKPRPPHPKTTPQKPSSRPLPENGRFLRIFTYFSLFHLFRPQLPKRHRTRRRHIQGVHPMLHRDADGVIAVRYGAAGQPGALGSQHNGQLRLRR